MLKTPPEKQKDLPSPRPNIPVAVKKEPTNDHKNTTFKTLSQTNKLPRDLPKDSQHLTSSSPAENKQVKESKSEVKISKTSPKYSKKIKEAFPSPEKNPELSNSKDKTLSKQGIPKATSDTLVTKENRNKSFKSEKQNSTSNPPSSLDRRIEDESRSKKTENVNVKTNPKPYKSKLVKTEDSPTNHLQPSDSKTSTYHIPPIKPHGNPSNTVKGPTDHLGKTITDNLKQYNQGFK